MSGLLLKSVLIVVAWIALFILYRILMKLAEITGAIWRSRPNQLSWLVTHSLFLLGCFGIIVAEVYLPIRLVMMIVRSVKGG